MAILLRNVIAQLESGYNVYAMRFEPNFYQRIRARFDDAGDESARNAMRLYVKIHGYTPSKDTMAAICATSWGMYQILGWNLFVYGLIGVPLPEWQKNPVIQDSSFDAFLARNGFDGWGDRPYNQISDSEKRQFARMYNGPGNVVGYVAAMDRAYRALSVQKGAS
jgi:hypothetical protein